MSVAKIHVLEGQYDEARFKMGSSAHWEFHRMISSKSFIFYLGANFHIPSRFWASNIRMA
jgi:hypothetical protein